VELIELGATDFCCFEEFRLPLSGAGLVWITGENTDSKAADNNGSGKSTIFKALTWGLYGKTIDGERGDKVIRSGQKTARVEVVLGSDEERWTVVRERRKGVPKLTLLQPNGKPFEASKDAVQERIEEMVGLDFPAFKNTVLYGQNDSARFAHPRTKDSERKEMLHRILRTGVLQDCHELVREHRLKLKKQIGEIEDEIRGAEIRLGEQDIEGLAEDVETFEEQREREVEQHKSKAREYRDRAVSEMDGIDEADEDSGEVEAAFIEEIEALEEALKITEDAANESQAVEEELKPLKTDEEKAMGVMARAVASLGSSRSSLERLDGQDRCYACNSPLDEGEALTFIEAVKKEIKDRKKKRDQAQKKLSAIREKIKAGRTKQEEYDAVARRERTLLEEFHEAEAKLEWWRREKETIATLRETAKERAADFVKLARQELAKAKDVKAQANPHAERLARAKKKRKEIKRQVKEFGVLKKEHAETLAHVEFWVRGFSNQGLPSYILDAVMPYVASRANHYLETLADGDIVMDFSTQREMKSSKGEKRDEIDISWEIEGLEDSYPPSGGQLKKMEIATDLALMDLVATREGENIDILALDEILDGLDGEGRQRVLTLLLEMRRRRGSVFVISHETEMSEIFEKAIIVRKADGVSTLATA
jgi:DNA repair exonuclease SbcCD ATPase subunit